MVAFAEFRHLELPKTTAVRHVALLRVVRMTVLRKAIGPSARFPAGLRRYANHDLANILLTESPRTVNRGPTAARHYQAGGKGRT